VKLQDPAKLISAAGTRLVLDRPFLGALALRLPAKPAGAWCKTVATDAKAIYYNPAYIQLLSISEVESVLAHEALHCALSHFSRRQHRTRHRWAIACDFAINALLVEEGMTLPPNALHIAAYGGMSAEEIYPLIDENTAEQPQDQHLYDDQNDAGHEGSENSNNGESGADESPDDSDNSEGADNSAGPPPPLVPDEKEILSTQWQQRTAGAAQQALQAGKLSAEMARLVDHLLQSQVPWRALLARFMSFTGRDDFNYHRPSRRSGDAILPSLRSAEVEVAVAIDTSGSISQRELEDFIAEIDALKGQVKARLILLACDAALHTDAPWIFEPWEHVEVPQLKGGGGTSFLPVFDWLAARDILPNALIYFTDAEGDFPKTAPLINTVWLVKGKQPVPFGERIQLN
jgi:predicted metal-dependent peptidase